MNILLTYYKCKDDWNDDRKLKQLVLEKILYHKSGFSRNFYREKWKKISHLLDELSKEEQKDNQDIDQMSGMFGQIMACCIKMMNGKNYCQDLDFSLANLFI